MTYEDNICIIDPEVKSDVDVKAWVQYTKDSPVKRWQVVRRNRSTFFVVSKDYQCGFKNADGGVNAHF